MIQKIRNFKSWLDASLRSLMETRPGQIPSLDGLRTLAVTLVIAGYCKNDLIHAGAEPTPQWLFSPLLYGWSGVDLFFVLSGFLIGRILFSEVQKTGTVKVGSFLLKRGMRIWPLYYFVCALVLTKMALMNQLPPVGAYLPDLLFINNFFHREVLIFGSWSLSVEEQYYAFASILILCSRGWVRSHSGKITHFIGFLFCCVPLARSWVWNYHASRGMDLNFLEWEVVHAYLFTHCDGLLVGLFLASLMVFRPQLAQQRSWVMPLLVLLTGTAGFLTWIDSVLFKYTFVSLLFGSAVWHCIAHPESYFSRLLSWKYFQIFSRLSYGMYIWYRFPLWRIASTTRGLLPDSSAAVQWVVVFFAAFTIAGFLAAITYVLIERPFLQLRDQYLGHPRRTNPPPAKIPNGVRVARRSLYPTSTQERVHHDHLDYT